MKNLITIYTFLFLLLVGCATVGKDFSFNESSNIELKKTTKNSVLQKFGVPFRVGYNNGDLQWTYSYYVWRLFSDLQCKDLVVSFDGDGMVERYEYNSSFEEDKVRILSTSNK